MLLGWLQYEIRGIADPYKCIFGTPTIRKPENTTLFVRFIKETLSWGFLKIGSILLSLDVII
jgi:hypothetical protein